MASWLGRCFLPSKTSPLSPHWRVQALPHHREAELDHSCRRHMGKIIRKTKTIPLGNAGHGRCFPIMCNGRGWAEPPKPHMEAPQASSQALISQLGLSWGFSLPSWNPCSASLQGFQSSDAPGDAGLLLGCCQLREN